MNSQIKNCIDYFSGLILNDLNKDGIYTMLAGGAVRNYFAGTYQYTDYDLYFNSENDLNECKDWFLDRGAELQLETERTIHIHYEDKDFDLVKFYVKNLEELIQEFDFTVCCVAVDIENLEYHETFFIDLAKRALVINNLPYPMSTLSRLQKYIKKGFTICQGGMLQIAQGIQRQLNETETEVDEEDLFNSVLSSNHSGNSIFMGID